MNAGTTFENCMLRVLLWSAFKTVVKITYDLSIFTIHETRYADGTIFH